MSVTFSPILSPLALAGEIPEREVRLSYEPVAELYRQLARNFARSGHKL
jgi:hypothetical protein